MNILNRINQLLDHMKNFKYDMFKKNGIWYIQQPDMLEQTKIGVCHDQSLYIYDRLTKLGIDCRLVYITDSNVTKTHSFVIIKQGNTEIWIESAWAKHRGLHTLKNGHMDVVKLWANSENININDIAVNDNVDTAILLNYNRNLTWGEYLSVVTKPFEGSESWFKYHDIKSKEIPIKLKNTNIYVGDENIGGKIISVLTGKKKKLKEVVTQLINIADNLAKKYNLPNNIYRSDKQIDDSINDFLEFGNGKNNFRVLTIYYIEFTPKNYDKYKNFIIKHIEDFSKQIPKEFSFACELSSRDNENTTLNIGITNSGNKQINIANFITKYKYNDTINKSREQMVKMIVDTIKKLLSSKYKTIQKGFDLEKDTVYAFIRENENYFKFRWDIWKVTDDARNEKIYNKIMEQYDKFIKELRKILKNNNYYLIDDGGDWDDTFIEIGPIKKGNENFLGDIFAKIFNLHDNPTTQIQNAKVAINVFKELLEKDAELKKCTDIKKYTSKDIEQFTNGELELGTLSYSTFDKENGKNDAINYAKKFQNFANDLAKKLTTLKYGITVYTSYTHDNKDNHYFIYCRISFVCRSKYSTYTPTNKPIQLQEKNIKDNSVDTNERKDMVNYTINCAKQAIRKFSDIEKGLTIKAVELSDFIKGYSNEVIIVDWDIWKVTKEAKNKEIYEQLNTQLFNFVTEMKTIFEQSAPNKNYYLRFDVDDWDGASIYLVTKNIGNESFVGSEGFIDWINGTSEGQIKKVVDRFKKSVESTISKYPLLKLNYNVKYDNFSLYESSISKDPFLKLPGISSLHFFTRSGNKLNEKTIQETNQFIDFINEVADKFNYDRYFIFAETIDTPIHMAVRIIVDIDQSYAKQHYKKFERIKYRNNNLKKIYYEVRKLIVPEIRQYLNLHGKYDIVNVDEDNSNLENWIAGNSKSAKLIYLDQDIFDNDESDKIYQKVNDFIKYFNNKLLKYSTLKAYMIIDPNDDSYSLDITFRNTSGNESFNILYKQSLAQYNYLSKLDFNSIATESFGSSIVRFLTGILNILSKIINNIKTSLLNGFKDLKRTELQYYIDENKFSINRILSVRYDLIANLSVPIPLGMISPYKVTTEKINTCINNLDMMNRMVSTLDSINNLVNSLLAGSSITIENNTLNMGELTAIENAFKNESKCFSISKRNSETEFSKVFLSDHCLKDTFILLDQATKEEYNVTKVYAILETIYQKFEQIITLVNSEDAILTKNDLLLLSAQTTTLAKIFDIYGVTMQDLQRVEHNFIFVMKQIKEYSGI